MPNEGYKYIYIKMLKFNEKLSLSLSLSATSVPFVKFLLCFIILFYSVFLKLFHDFVSSFGNI